MQINVTSYLNQSAKRFPDKIAVDDTQQTLTFKQLQCRALRLAEHIAEHRLQNCPVAVFMQKGCEMVMSFAAINYSGNFYIPIDTKSPDYRIKSIFDSLQSKIVLTNRANYEKLKSLYDGEIICTDAMTEENTSPDRITDRKNKLHFPSHPSVSNSCETPVSCRVGDTWVVNDF
jgi:acyl-CoA synthetase (AMP-forming)/AMP-acid ligase II